jgi:hypothetical protein
MIAAAGALGNSKPGFPPRLDLILRPWRFRSPTSRRKTPARPFQRTPRRHAKSGLPWLGRDLACSLLRWLALRGSPPGNLCLPDMIF